MKIMYLSDYKSYRKGNGIGVVNKIRAHEREFNKAGIKVRHVEISGKDLRLGPIVFPARKCSPVERLEQYDALYIRFVVVSPDLIRFVRRYKKKRPDGKVILEIPTYPFKHEEIQGPGRVFYYCNMTGMFLLHFYLDRVAIVSSPLVKYMKIPVIPIRNGVDYDRVAVRNAKSSDGVIHIACVGNFVWPHGYDRLLEGLAEYVRQPQHREIVLHMVGRSKIGEDLMQMVKTHHLQKNVIFHGYLMGEKLDEIYDMCDLSAASMGDHRIDLKISSSLKSREYAAKGLPILTASNLDIYNQDTAPYVCKFPADESAIDFNQVVLFYDKIYGNTAKQDVANHMRSIFKKYCSMEEGFKEVVSFIKAKNI